MSVVSVRARSFILALFIRDDGERFLLGDNGYDFIDSQLHFSANTIENDEVEKQGVDGTMLAGQVRRASVQTFDGYVGDATTPKEEIEQMRREFIAFFAKNHHFRVIYVDCNRNAWQRKGGYLVDAPEVKELWQIHPEYHVGLNFEDVNYYEYDENAEGQEILANIMKVPISSAVEGGLVWDEDGAVSEDATVIYDGDTATASGTSITIADAVEAPLSDFKLKGETSQNGTPTPDAPVAVQVVTGENTVEIYGKNIFNKDKALDNYFYTSTGSKSTYSKAQFYNKKFITASDKITMSYSGVHDKQGGSNIEANVRIVQYDASGNFISRLMSRTNGYTFTLNANTKSFILCVDNGPDAWFDNLQVEIGSSATAYEPCQEQSYEVNLGKNLFDKDNAGGLFEGYISGGKAWAASGYWSYYIPCKPNTTYTASRTIIGNGGRFAIATSQTVPGNNVGVAQLAQDNTATTLTITTNSSAKYIIVWFANVNDAGSESLADWAAVQQLEKGSQASSYAAYFIPIELCKIGTYQDYIYKSGGKWYVRKEVGKAVLDGSEAWETPNNRSYSLYKSNSKISDMSLPVGTLQMFCDYFTPTQLYDEIGSVGTGNSFINFNYDGTSSNLAAFKTWLANNNVSLYAPLATPTDAEITDAALVAQLEAILSQGETYAGTNNITTVIPAGNEQGELEITYYTTYEAKVVGGGYVWEEGGSGGPTVIVNESISAVSPVWTVYGPALNPQLENATNGDVIEYVGLIADGQTLVIDMGEQTAKLDGLNVISNVTGDFISLESGANTLLYSAGNDAPESEIGWSEIVG